MLHENAMPVTSGRVPNPLLIEYVCSKCGTHLKTTDARIDKLHIVEDCPSCGISLSKSLTVKNQSLEEQTPSLPTALNHPKFVLASSYPRLKFGIHALDQAIAPLVTGDMLCISGPHATSLLEGLCCQSLLP